MGTSRKACVAALLLAGCTGIGPGTVARDRYEYSSSISDSWKRQTLLNIVKLRYFDPPIFVDVGQIVAGYSIESALTGGGTLVEGGGLGQDAVTLGGSVKYTDRPTITYTPLTGNKFVKALMTPISPDAVFSTIQAGWPADSVLLATTASINGLRNQETNMSGVTPPEPDFLRVLELMRSVQRTGVVSMRVKVDADKRTTSILTFRDKDIDEKTLAEVREIRSLLRLDPDANELSLVLGGTSSGGKEIAVLTRSLLHILSTMAAQVEAPPEDVAEGRATPGRQMGDEAGGATGLVRIRCSNAKPADAFVAVSYRGRWFWIDDRDLRSKRAFAFMLMLFTLTDTDDKEGLPLITIPAQ